MHTPQQTEGVGPEADGIRGQVMLWTIVLVGLALRVVWAVLVPVEPVSDGVAYHTFATNIVEHGVYGWSPETPGAYWPVGTSAILAALYFVFGPGFTALVVFNIAISIAVILQVFWLGRHYFDLRKGLIAAALIAGWPSLIMYVTVVASEVIFIFFLLGGLMALEARWRSFWLGVLLAGLFWAAAAYVRPLALLVPLIFGASLVLRRQAGLGLTLLRVALIYVLMIAAITPWSARNTEVFGSRVLISTNFGPVFWMGNNPETTGAYQQLPDWTKGMSETERAEALKKAAFDYVAEAPGTFVLRTVMKFIRLHERETIAVAWNRPQIEALGGAALREALKVLATAYWGLVLLLAIWGCWQLLKGPGLWQLMIHPAFLGWMYVAWVHAIILLGDRYHIPAIPFVVLLAAFGAQATRIPVLGHKLKATS